MTTELHPAPQNHLVPKLRLGTQVPKLCFESSKRSNSQAELGTKVPNGELP